MDYFDVIKRALTVTWKYKALWVLGFFVGGGSGGGGGSSSSYSRSFTFDSTSDSMLAAELERIGEWLALYWLPLVLLGGAVLAFSLFFSVAAQGGLIHMVNESEENRQVRLRDGWREGFRRWGRTFMIDAATVAPILALIAALVAAVVAAVGGIIYAGDSSASAAGGAFVGFCCGFLLLIVALIIAAFVLGVVQSLALRYGVLQDVSFGQALARGWNDLFGKRGAFVFELAMIIPGLVYAAAIGMFSLVFTVPSAMMLASGSAGPGAALSSLLALILIVPASAYAAFQSSAWTIFFRRMNGLELAPAAQVPAPGQNDFLPPPPEPPAPESPPYV